MLGNLTDDMFDKFVILVATTLILCVGLSPGRAPLYLECKLASLYTENLDDSKNKMGKDVPTRFWQEIRSDLIGICMIASTRACFEVRESRSNSSKN